MGITCHDTAWETSDVGQLGKSSRVESPTALASPPGTTVAMSPPKGSCHPDLLLVSLQVGLGWCTKILWG